MHRFFGNRLEADHKLGRRHDRGRLLETVIGEYDVVDEACSIARQRTTGSEEAANDPDYGGA
jgi:hypothetical protein